MIGIAPPPPLLAPPALPAPPLVPPMPKSSPVTSFSAWPVLIDGIAASAFSEPLPDGVDPGRGDPVPEVDVGWNEIGERVEVGNEAVGTSDAVGTKEAVGTNVAVVTCEGSASETDPDWGGDGVVIGVDGGDVEGG